MHTGSTVAELGTPSQDGTPGLLRIGSGVDTHEVQLYWNATAGRWVSQPFFSVRQNSLDRLSNTGTMLALGYVAAPASGHNKAFGSQPRAIHRALELWNAGLRLQENLSGLLGDTHTGTTVATSDVTLPGSTQILLAGAGSSFTNGFNYTIAGGYATDTGLRVRMEPSMAEITYFGKPVATTLTIGGTNPSGTWAVGTVLRMVSRPQLSVLWYNFDEGDEISQLISPSDSLTGVKLNVTNLAAIGWCSTGWQDSPVAAPTKKFWAPHFYSKMLDGPNGDGLIEATARARWVGDPTP